MNKNPIVLSLGGGGAKTFAHLGVLDALKKYNINVDYLVTCSAASVIGVLYGLGISSKEIKKEFKRKRKWLRLIRHSVFKQILKKFLTKYKIDNLNKLNLPISIVAVDLKSGEEIIFDKGDPLSLALASSSFPGISKPFKYLDYELIDGGVLKPDPADIARKKVGENGIVISVTLKLEFEKTKTKNRINTVLKSILLLSDKNRKKILNDNSDIVISPSNNLKISFHDWKETFLGYYYNNKIEEYYQKGFDSVEKEIDKIKKIIDKKIA